MKKYIFIIFIGISLVITGLIFLSHSYRFKGGIILPVDNISSDVLAQKFNVSTIKNKYQLDGVVLKRNVNNDLRDEIRVQIGDNKPTTVQGVFGGTATQTQVLFESQI